jgi:hypothetical protein
MARIKIEVDKQAELAATKLLEQIDDLVRGPAITGTLRSMGNAVKKEVQEVLPKPGYPGDKPEYKPLRDTLSVRVKSYDRGGKIVKVLVVGYRWPEGAHGQPLEAGHKIANQYGQHDGMVEPRAFIAETVERTKPSQAAALLDGARKMLAKVQSKG